MSFDSLVECSTCEARVVTWTWKVQGSARAHASSSIIGVGYAQMTLIMLTSIECYSHTYAGS